MYHICMYPAFCFQSLSPALHWTVQTAVLVYTVYMGLQLNDLIRLLNQNDYAHLSTLPGFRNKYIRNCFLLYIVFFMLGSGLIYWSKCDFCLSRTPIDTHHPSLTCETDLKSIPTSNTEEKTASNFTGNTRACAQPYTCVEVHENLLTLKYDIDIQPWEMYVFAVHPMFPAKGSQPKGSGHSCLTDDLHKHACTHILTHTHKSKIFPSQRVRRISACPSIRGNVMGNHWLWLCGQRAVRGASSLTG